MTVQVSTKRFETIRRRGGADTRHGAERPQAADHRARDQRARPQRDPEPQPATDRRLTNDRALYNCQCGYVFQAPVSTSVGCPHCGGTQAW